MPIHPTAVVDPAAEIHPEADIGPLTVIQGRVRIGRGTRVIAGAFLFGDTELGEDNVIYPGALIGVDPQDMSYKGEKSRLVVGNRNTFREHTEIHRGTAATGETVIGNDGFFMNHCHVAHDCRISDRVIMAGGSLLAGHVHLGERAFLSGNCVVHQFCRIGTLAMFRGLSGASRDVPPYCICDNRGVLRGINVIGMRRAGIPSSDINAVRKAFRTIFMHKGNFAAFVARAEQEANGSPMVATLIEFLRAPTKRGITMGSSTTDPDDGMEG